jgi:antitoxin CptB
VPPQAVSGAATANANHLGQKTIMSGAQAKTYELDARQKRILFRSWHRGIREMDLILGRFADAEIANLCESELDDYEGLLEVPDRDLFSWITGEAIPPTSYDTPVLHKIRNFHNHAAPIHI